MIQKWKVSFVRRAGKSPARQRPAKITVNSTLRLACSLFSPKRLAFLNLNLPLQSPFDGIQFEARQSMVYRSSFDLEKLIRDATGELDEEALKVFLLASMAGLRRNEIDKLTWSAFNWERGSLRVEVTEHFETKSEDSMGEMDLDEEFVAIFRKFHLEAKQEFVIESRVKPSGRRLLSLQVRTHIRPLEPLASL